MKSGDLMKRPEGREIAEITPEQLAGVLFHLEQLMQGMAGVVNAMNRRMDELERQFKLITPITGGQEKAISAQIKRRAGELQRQYRLDASTLPAISGAIRKELKLVGGVNSIRELPRIEFNVYLDRIALWDDYRTMKEIRLKDKAKKERKEGNE